MSYLDDYDDNVNSKKIPYDDIPISRNVQSHGSRKTTKNLFTGSKLLIGIIVVLFVANIILCSTMFYYLKNGKVKDVKYYYNNITATEESVSAIASNTAYWSSVCVAAGGSCSNEQTFFNNTLSRGSGVIYKVDKENGVIYFVTCYHVVSGYDKNEIYVMLPSQLIPITVELVSYSSHYDVAVLKYENSNVENVLDGCTPIQTYDSTYLSMGDLVFAVGNPLSGGFSITGGRISRINTFVTIDTNSYETREIQTDAAINPGNSGGGLFNSEGKFVGLVNAKLNTTKTGSSSITVAGTAFAIPGTLALGIADSIIRNEGKATYIDLGITLDYEAAMGKTLEEIDFNGKVKYIEKYTVVVKSVKYGSSAYRQLQTGDIIEFIEFEIYENGQYVTKKIEMFNKYVLEDYSFSNIKDNKIVFYIRAGGTNEELDKVTVVASSLANIQ